MVHYRATLYELRVQNYKKNLNIKTTKCAGATDYAGKSYQHRYCLFNTKVIFVEQNFFVSHILCYFASKSLTKV